MAPRTRPGDARGSGAPNMVPVFMTIGVVVVAALAVAVMNQSAQQDEAPEPGAGGATPEEVRDAAASAFGDVDTSPKRTRRAGAGKTDAAPPGLADAEVFAEARALAAEGKELVAAALAAQKAGDDATYREKGAAAREKYEKAMEVTADWEIDLITRYGSDDRQVDRIGREIDGWRKQLNKVRKVQ